MDEPQPSSEPASPPAARTSKTPAAHAPSSADENEEASSPAAAKKPAKKSPGALTADRLPKASSNGGADLTNALKVSIKPSSRDENLFMMRLLKPGEDTPPGYRPALVVMVDPKESGE